jgi:phage terminase large subunit-like protein
MTNVAEVLKLVQAIQEKRASSKLHHYKPYEYQKRFHSLRDAAGNLATIRVLQAANQVGKSYCAAMETAMHATGLYPSWWDGLRFAKPVDIMVGSTTNETGRDICQKELFGEPDDPSRLGTGTVPRDCIGDLVRKPGVPNAMSSAMVKHVSGGLSKISFRAYEQGPQKHMGLRIDFGWLDEEPPHDIYSQYIRATLATHGKLILSFTPENGITQVVNHFMNDIQPGEAMMTASWDDAEHFKDPAVRAEKLARISEHEREMRSKGIPMMGSGLVFPVKEEEIAIDPMPIPDHWPRICGIDFGYDHPFAAAWIAWDRDADTVYLYDCYRESKQTPPIHAAAIRSRGEWIPIVWPHDGLQHDKGSGVPLADQYRQLGLNLTKEKFSNPPSPGQEEGEGGQGVEAGIMEMLTRMQTGRFKVFKTCREWLEEARIYHRKDGKLVKLFDDTISASRYAAMSLRHAQVQAIRFRPRAVVSGVSNW